MLRDAIRRILGKNRERKSRWKKGKTRKIILNMVIDSETFLIRDDLPTRRTSGRPQAKDGQ